MPTSRTIYTLGHSRHPLAAFLALLRDHQIDLVADTRGQPYSRYNPQFNRAPFERALREAGLGYLWVGDALSGRPRDPRFRGPDGAVLWGELQSAPEFVERLEEVAALARGRRLALVCAEEDPRRCHRRFLLTPALVARGVEVLHVRGDGRVESESDIAAAEQESGNGRQLNLFSPPRS